MKHWRWPIAILAALAIIAGGWHLLRRQLQPPLPAEQPARFAILDARGHTIVGADDIARYDWPSHTITLRPGAAFAMDIKEGDSLVHGIPFRVVAEGEECYRGVITTLLSSVAHGGQVIDIHAPGVADGVVRIEYRGHPLPDEPPSERPGPDARSDPRVRSALLSLGKLAE